jgi:hypothetical protein
MLAEIETKILQRLVDEGLSADTTGAITPAVYCRIESGRFARSGQEAIRAEGTVSLDFVFNSGSIEDTRRNVVFPILTAALNILTLQDLGLEIDPLVPVSFQNITGTSDEAAGLLVYRMQFETRFSIRKIDDETIANLMKVALDYYLQEPVDDGVKDGSDEITLGT